MSTRRLIIVRLSLCLIHVFLKKMYRTADTEESVGAAIRNSGIARSELFVTTKLP